MLHANRSTRRLRAAPLAMALACALFGLDADRAQAMTLTPTTATAPAARYALRLESRRQRALREPLRSHPSSPHGGNLLPVTSCLDDDDPGTLRNVLAGAAEGDTVDLSALTCSTITLTQGAVDSSALGMHQLYDVTIQGPGRDALTIDAAGQSQVFSVGGFSSDKGTFTANDLSIANGYYAGGVGACVEGFGGTVALNRVLVTDCHSVSSYGFLFGGAVDVNALEMTDSTITRSDVTGTGVHSTVAGAGAYAGGDATLIRSTISDNHATAPYAQRNGYASVGGGLYVRGNLSVIDSTISGNSIEATNAGQDAKGGGIYVRGIASISGSTIDGNSADGEGGGVFKAIYSVYGEPGGTNPTTKLTIVDSTISGNTAAYGAGIGSSRPLYLSNSTIANNSASDGGGGILFRLAGIEDSGGTLQLQSTIVATNSAGPSATFAADLDADDVLAIDGGNDLVMAAGATIPLPGDTIAEDPLLSPLAFNGGPTRTQALGAGSPAIDTGNNTAALDFDQRGTGFARVSGSAADIGAFELQQAPDDVIFEDGFDGAAPGM